MVGLELQLSLPVEGSWGGFLLLKVYGRSMCGRFSIECLTDLTPHSKSTGETLYKIQIVQTIW